MPVAISAALSSQMATSPRDIRVARRGEGGGYASGTSDS